MFWLLLNFSVAQVGDLARRRRLQRWTHDWSSGRVAREAVEGNAHVHGFPVTLLRLLDDKQLTVNHAGRFKQLNHSGGKLIKELIT